MARARNRAAGNAAEVRPRIRVVRKGDILLGPGKADLLDAIGRHGRLRGAADELEMSYMRAWKLVQLMNRAFRGPLVETGRGGSAHGTATLTPLGRLVLRLYRRMDAASRRATAPAGKSLLRLLAP